MESTESLQMRDLNFGSFTSSFVLFLVETSIESTEVPQMRDVNLGSWT